jgi:uncharacterized protein YraI
LNGQVVLNMVNGTRGTVLEGPQPLDGFTWWHLQVGQVNGWAAGEFLAAVREAAPVAPRFQVGATVQSTDNGVNFRAAPGLQAQTIRQLSAGEMGTIVGGPQDADGHTWWQLRIATTVGWTAGEFLAPSAPVEPAALSSAVLELRQWIPLNAPVQNMPGARSRDSYDQVIDEFGVDRNPRYQPHDGLTFCNIFVSDVTRAMNAQIPHRVSASGDPDDGGRELTVAGMVDWLHGRGADFGWSQAASGQDAQTAANAGQPTVVITPAGVTFDEEHTAIIRPADFDPTNGPEMAQAGARCLRAVRLAQIFGSRPVEFWVHA